MASSTDPPHRGRIVAAASEEQEDVAQVWRDLQKGEQTAQALESNLTNLEKKIDDLLASFEDSERSMVEEASASTPKEKPSAGDHTGAADDKAKSQES